MIKFLAGAIFAPAAFFDKYVKIHNNLGNVITEFRTDCAKNIQKEP